MLFLAAGVTFNQVFPDWVLVILLSILLVLLSARTLQSGMRLHRKEVASQKEQAQVHCLLHKGTKQDIVSAQAAS